MACPGEFRVFCSISLTVLLNLEIDGSDGRGTVSSPECDSRLKRFIAGEVPFERQVRRNHVEFIKAN
jgi:hypothetical protein